MATDYDCPHCGRNLDWVSLHHMGDGDVKEEYDCPPCGKDFYAFNKGELRER